MGKVDFNIDIFFLKNGGRKLKISDKERIKLESMQIKGIRWMILSNIDTDAIESRLCQITGQGTVNDINKFVYCQSRETLIKLIEQSPEITGDNIASAYEKYRYGLKPGFVLFWAKNCGHEEISQNILEDNLKEYLSSITYSESSKYKNLTCRAIDTFAGIYEISVSYLQRFNYIDANGEFTSIYMMKEGFIWVGIDKNFIAINNMPEVLMKSLKNFFSHLYKADITNIKITNNLLKKVFSEDNAKRITRHSSNPPENQLEKVTFADSKLSEKMSFIPEGYEKYEVTNTQYIEEIDDGITGTLGVNCNKGKMYLSKSLTSTQFREWSIRRIGNIIDYFQTETDITLESVSAKNMFTSSAWDGIKQTAIPILNDLVYAILNCKKNKIDNYPLSFDVSRIYTELSKCFIGKIAFVCDNCNEKAIPCCNECGRSIFTITKRSPIKVICSHCGENQQNTFSFTCESGHINTFNEIDNVLELVSTDEFSSLLFNTIQIYYPDTTFLPNEYLIISSSGIDLCDSPDYEKLKPSDIIDFQPICNRSLVQTPENLISIFETIKEKCLYPTKEMCATCKNKTCTTVRDIGCLLKLFENFEGYIPQPHQGHEFGDVSMLLSLHGRNYTFTGIAKSSNGKITKASKVGREIIQQSIDVFNDERAEIIGIIYPELLDDQLKYLLFNEAKLRNKRIVILDQEFMLKLLDKYIEDNGITNL